MVSDDELRRLAFKSEDGIWFLDAADADAWFEAACPRNVIALLDRLKRAEAHD